MMSEFGTMLSLPLFSLVNLVIFRGFSSVFSLFGCGGNGLVILRFSFDVGIHPAQQLDCTRTNIERSFTSSSLLPSSCSSR